MSFLVGAADLCGPQPAARYHKTKHPTAPDERAAGVCGPYGRSGRTEEFMGVFEQIKQGLEEAIDYEKQEGEKLREVRTVTLTTRDTMTPSQFDAMMGEGLKQAKAGQGVDLEEAFALINK